MTPAAPPLLFRRFFAAGSLAACAALGAFAPSLALAADAPVRGLIVQLRDAPAHLSLAREYGQQAATRPLAAREGARWQRVLGAAPELRLASRRAVGASAQLLRFDRPLKHAQAEALAQRFGAMPEVAWVALNTRERRLETASGPPNDFYFGDQWWLHPVSLAQRGAPGFQSAWTQTTIGAAGAVVAVLDTGTTSHPELNGRLLPGYDLVDDAVYANDGDGRDDNPSDPGDWVSDSDIQNDPGRFDGCEVLDSSWHGTAIAGILAANTNNVSGVAGINWQGKVLPVRVAGKCGADVADIIDGMRWAAGLDVCRLSSTNGECLEAAPRNANPARILNISFGGTGSCDPYQPTINELRERGIVIVAAAGNEAVGPTRPAKCAGVVGVVALNRDGFKSHYSNFGAALSASGIATVGGDDPVSPPDPDPLADSGVLSIGNRGRTSPDEHWYFFYYGTSFSAPVVAGAASLMLSVNPSLSYDQIVDGLKSSARPHASTSTAGLSACSAANPGRCLCTTQTCGAGILDAAQAAVYAREAQPVSGGGGGGGGTTSVAWLLALAAATAALWRRRRR
jgi:serine protease